jgi:hypothetical protein
MENKTGPKATSSTTNNEKPKEAPAAKPQSWDFMKKYEAKPEPKVAKAPANATNG